MKKTTVVIGFLICFALVAALGVGLIDMNENRKLDRRTIDGRFHGNLSRFASSLLPAEKMENYDADRIEQFKIESSRYIYGAEELFSLSSHHDCENLRVLISGLYFLTQIDKLQFAITEEDIEDLMYLSAHMFDKDLVESLSGELVERIRPFDYSINS